MIKKSGKYIVGTLALMLAFSIVSMALDTATNWYYRKAPASRFFEYSKTYTLSNSHQVNAPYILMRNIVEWKRNDMKAFWTDTLKCYFNDDEGWVFVGSQSSSGAVSIKPADAPVSSWKLNIKMPDRPGTCKVNSLIEVLVEGHLKTQTIESNTFEVVQ